MQIKENLREEYAKYVEVNSQDEYSKCVVTCAEVFGNAIDEGKTFEEAEQIMLDTEDGDGLTGFMVGALMSGIAHFHPRGEEVKEWWNKRHNGTPDETTGVNNPAIITF